MAAIFGAVVSEKTSFKWNNIQKRMNWYDSMKQVVLYFCLTVTEAIFEGIAKLIDNNMEIKFNFRHSTQLMVRTTVLKI